MGKLLGIFARPDDETAVNGGTLAKYAYAGWQVDLIIATRGDAGGWGDVTPDAGQSLSDVRTKELEIAGKHLGVHSITFLDYKDSFLSERSPGDVEDVLVRMLKEMRPDVVITHEPGGITNHPDHVKVSLATTFAFQTYGSDRNEENPSDIKSPKLYYSCLPQSVISYVVKNKYFPSELFDKPVIGVDDKRISTVIDIKRFAGAKKKAFMAHATQEPILAKYMNILHNPFLMQEYFILRYIGVQEIFMGKNDRISDRL